MNSKPQHGRSQQALTTDDKLGFGLRDASALVGVSESHLRRLVKAGAVPVVRIGHRLIVPREALTELLKTAA